MWPWLAAAAFYSVTTVVLLWPLVTAASVGLTQPSDDPILVTWILWWNTQALPGTAAWWNAPIFYPTAATLAFSEVLLGLLPLTAPVQWITGDPVLAHNVAVLASFPLCALSAHLLCFELTNRHDAALIGGLAFGFSVLRANEIGHLQMLSYYWLPVALVALHRFRSTMQWRWLVVFSAAGVMQVLCNGYALFQLPLLVTLWVIWFSTSWRMATSVGAALAFVALPVLPLLLQYQSVQAELHLQRTIDDVRRFSADIASLVSAPADNVFWGRLLTSHQSYGLFPGFAVIACIGASAFGRWPTRSSPPRGSRWLRRALAAIALIALLAFASVLVAGPWTLGPLSLTRPHKPLTIAILAVLGHVALGSWWRPIWRSRSSIAFYALATVSMYVLAFGPEPRLFGARVFYKAPYAWLMALPGFHAIRAPDRFAMLGVLCVAVVAALAYVRWSERLGRWRGPVIALLCAGVILDGWFRVHVDALPSQGPRATWNDARAILELPLTPARDAHAVFRAMRYDRPIVNGVSGYTPPHYAALVTALAAGDLTAIHELTARGPIGIVVDRAAPESTDLIVRLAALDGIDLISHSTSWSTYMARRSSIQVEPLGPAIQIANAFANRGSDHITWLTDGRLETMWSSRLQEGGEEITLELASSAIVGAIVMQLGGCPFGFPRDLAVDTSVDGALWAQVRRLPTATAALRAGLANPHEVPVAVVLPPTTARWVRLRQMAREESVPWCVAELSVHASGQR